jgi:hypothetical protein
MLAFGIAILPSHPGRAAEFGANPWVKGFTDIYAGILPAAPGFYFRSDAYHYEASVERTIRFRDLCFQLRERGD